MTSGFGAKIAAGTISAVKKVTETKQPAYNPQGRLYINPDPTDPTVQAKTTKIYSDDRLIAMAQGRVALYQRFPYLDCRVPWCHSSQWFERP